MEQNPIPSSCIGFPDEDVMSCIDGLVENHDYRDMRGYDAQDWHLCWEHEEEMLVYEGDEDSDEAWDSLGDNMLYMLGVDPGVATTVVALSVIGACPVTSCSGGQGHYESHPLVLCWCSKEQFVTIAKAAEATGVELAGVSTPGILIYTHEGIDKMREFSRKVLEFHEGG